jgi:hypothetical protein
MISHGKKEGGVAPIYRGDERGFDDLTPGHVV